MSKDLPVTGRIAGVDFGTRRIGVAVSDSRREIASPLHTYSRQTKDLDAAHFRKLVEDEEIVGFVVGLPIHMSGDESAKSQEARAFGAWLAAVTGLPVCFHDERLSTVAADGFLATGNLTSKQRRSRRDMLAAQIVLASFLEAHQPPHRREPLDDRPEKS